MSPIQLVRTHPMAALATALLVASVAAGCATGGDTAGTPAALPTAVPTAAATTSRPTTSAAETQTQTTSWTMPNLVGRNLQDAQDAIQALTSYGIAITRSHDATGAGRHQILDRDWKVCAQNVAPGTAITSATQIDFAAAKLAERC